MFGNDIHVKDHINGINTLFVFLDVLYVFFKKDFSIFLYPFSLSVTWFCWWILLLGMLRNVEKSNKIGLYDMDDYRQCN